MSISNTVIASTETAILTVPALKNYASVVIIFANPKTSDETIDIYAIPSGGGAGADGNTIYPKQVIPAGMSWTCEIKLILSAGDKIAAKGMNGAIVTATPSFMEI